MADEETTGIEVQEGHPVAMSFVVRFEPDEALEFARACERHGLLPGELLVRAFREFEASRAASRKTA